MMLLRALLVVAAAGACAFSRGVIAAVPSSYQYKGTPALQRHPNPDHSLNAIVLAVQAGVQPVVNTAAIETALRGLRDGSIVLEDPNLTLMRGTNEMKAVEMLWNSFMRMEEDHSISAEVKNSMRELVLEFLHAGMNTSHVFRNGHFQQSGNVAGTPLGYLLREMKDPELFDAFLDNGHPTRGTLVHVPPRHKWTDDRVAILGTSLIHFVANSGLEIKAIRDFYKVYNCLLNTAGALPHVTADGSAVADGQLVTYSAEERQSAQDTCIAKSLVKRITPYSTAAREIISRMRLGAPLGGRNMSYLWARRIDEELHKYVLDRLFDVCRDEFEWLELLADVPSTPMGRTSHSNPVLLAATLGKSGVIEAIVGAIQKLSDPLNAKYARDILRIALSATTRYQRRCALHIAALRRGKQSKLWKAMVAAEQLASGNLARLGELKDAFGRTPNDYDGTGTTATRYNVVNPPGLPPPVDAAPEILGGDAMIAPGMRVGVDTDGGTALAIADGFGGNNGGWGFAGTPGSDPAGLAAPSRCDIHQYQGMPSRAQLIDIIERNQPSIFRGAVTNWTFRDAWSKNNFLRKYGRTDVHTSEIPYATGFDEAALDRVQKMSEFIAGWGTDDNLSPTGNAMYLFGSDYTDENPSLKGDMAELYALLGDPAKDDDSIKELSPQFFIGPAGSGAPMHWHNTALNALAWGEKKWYLLRPNETFYSVLPSLRFAHEEVPQLRADGVPLMECTQQAGDLMFAGESFGHATLNTMPTIGFALEFYLADLDIAVTVPNFEYDVKFIREQQEAEALQKLRRKQYSSAKARRNTGSSARGGISAQNGNVGSGTPHQPYMAAAKASRRRRHR